MGSIFTNFAICRWTHSDPAIGQLFNPLKIVDGEIPSIFQALIKNTQECPIFRVSKLNHQQSIDIWSLNNGWWKLTNHFMVTYGYMTWSKLQWFKTLNANYARMPPVDTNEDSEFLRVTEILKRLGQISALRYFSWNHPVSSWWLSNQFGKTWICGEKRIHQLPLTR